MGIREQVVRVFQLLSFDKLDRVYRFNLHILQLLIFSFPGVIDALNFAESPLYILTTKQTRFCKLLLERNGVRNIPENRIYGYGSGTKISVLKAIMKFPEAKGRSLVFVEDRYETLEKATLSLLGQPIEYFLASWGYNTEAARSEASKHPFINLLDLPSFTSKLQ